MTHTATQLPTASERMNNLVAEIFQGATIALVGRDRAKLDESQKLVAAEGVETDVALAELTRLGCDRAQGFFISKPVAAAELDHWLSIRRAALPVH